MFFADLRDFVERRLVAAADKEHLALVFADFQMANDFDRVRMAERKIKHDELGEAMSLSSVKKAGVAVNWRGTNPHASKTLLTIAAI